MIEDIDDYGDNGTLNENIDGDADIQSDREDNEGEQKDGEEGKGVKVEHKKPGKRRNIIRPLERIMGERGLQSIGEYYKGMKFKGKYNEKDDLNEVMKRLQHWAHRALPTMKFDDSLTIIEGLTKKKQVQSHMTKYRLDMLEPVIVQQEDLPEQQELAPIDEFDDLLSDQIEQMTRVQQNKTMDRSHTFNKLRDNVTEDSLGCAEIPKTPPKTLTSEQMAQIAENRRKAQERLKQKKLQESLQNVDEEM